jgi:uncharacterized membrane protein YeiH
MLMLCFLLGAGHCLVSAVNANTEKRSGATIAWSCGMFVLLALLCLTCRMSIWCAIGMLVFTGLYFRPQGMHTAIGGGMIRDMLTVRIPVVLKSDFYATAALIGGSSTVRSCRSECRSLSVLPSLQFQ